MGVHYTNSLLEPMSFERHYYRWEGGAKIVRTIKFLVRLIVFDVPSFAVSSDKQLRATSSNVHDAFDPTHFSPPPKPVHHQDHIKL